MKKLFSLFLLIIVLIACSKQEKNTTITGEVKGLKKGTLYLEKLQDTLLITLDSIDVSGNSQFAFNIQLESPEMLYLFLKKTAGHNVEDGLEFFAEPGIINLTTTLNDFKNSAVISGSENHNKLLEYHQLMQRYNDKNLELFAENLEAGKTDDDSLKATINKKYENLIKSRYIATINFAVNNNDYEVAPYLALSEIFDAHIKYLDTIYNVLTPKVKSSTYGKELEKYLKERKQNNP